MCSLVSLSLRCCELTDQQLIPINEALKENVPLQQLDIGQNCISDTGIQLMADSLRMNRNLLSLVLSRNNITDIGVMYLAQVQYCKCTYPCTEYQFKGFKTICTQS